MSKVCFSVELFTRTRQWWSTET